MKANLSKYRRFHPLCIWMFKAGIFIPCSAAQAAGVAAFKQQQFHSDDLATPIVYSAIRETATTYQFDIGNKMTAYDKVNIAGYVTVPPLPSTIKNEAEANPVRKSVEELSTFVKRYKKTAEILNPHIEHLSKAVRRFDDGEVRLNDRWLSKLEYAAMLKKEADAQEAMRQAEIERQKVIAAMQEKEAAFALSQREKGLEKYGDEWLPKNKAEALQIRDHEIAVSSEKVQAKSIRNLKYSVFQVISDGMLIKPLQGSIQQGGLNVDLVYLHGAAKGTAAEGDLYKDDVFWCGTYTFPTTSGDTTTVHAYSLSRNDAIDRVRKTLFGESLPVSEPPKREKAPVVSSGPLADAVSTGSGFFVGNQGHFVSNSHVVGDAKSVEILFNGRLIPATVIHSSRAADLALLKTEEQTPGIEFGVENFELGMDVFAIGFPNPDIQGTDVKVTKGIVSSKKGYNDDDTRFQIDAAIQPGNSGGPLCDSSGRLVGVIVSALNSIMVAKETGSIPQNVNYAIKSSEVAAFLRSRSIAVPAAPASDANASDRTSIKKAISCAGLVIVKK